MNTAYTDNHRNVRRVGLICVSLLLAVGAGACSDDDGDETVALADWVAQFDETCVDTMAKLSDPALTEEEWASISDTAITEMRALPAPDEMTDTVAQLLDAIEASSDSAERSDQEAEILDQQVLSAMTTLGVSDACIHGPSD